MRKVILYITVALIIFTLASQGTLVTKKVATNNYHEECLHEGCSFEEVRELYDSYREECINEGCSREEVIELGGNPSGALAMAQHFRQLGFEVREQDFRNLDCTFLERKESCGVIVMMCQDRWKCPDREHYSSWYVCGPCFLDAGC